MTTTLPGGLVIPSDAENKLLRFAKEEFEYYDGIIDPSPDEITPMDVFVTIGVNSRIQSAERIRSIHRGMSESCRSLLSLLPVELDLTDEHWQPDVVERLLAAACSVPFVLMPVATKVLHRKRRALIPMLDSVVLKHYLDDRDLGRTQDKRKAAALGMRTLRRFRDDLIVASHVLGGIRRELEQSGYRLTSLRILEILVWIEKEPSGVYRS